MSRLSAAAIVVTALLGTSSALADKAYTGSATHDCKTASEVSVNASNGTFTFVGTCEKISINGSENKIVVENVKKIALNGSKNLAELGAADRIAVNGSDNTVTYRKGLSATKPKIGGVGANNSVTQK